MASNFSTDALGPLVHTINYENVTGTQITIGYYGNNTPQVSDSGAMLTPPPLTTSDLVWYYINGIVGILIALLGIPGNVVSAAVLLLPIMRNSTSLLLVIMAVYDTVFLLLHVLLQSLTLVFMVNDVCHDYLLVQEFLFKYFYAVLHIAYTGTVYMTLLVTLERAMVILLPLRAKQICTRARAGLASAVVFLWAVLYNIPRCLEYEPVVHSNRSLVYTDYSVTKSNFGNSHFFNVIYLHYLHSVFHFALPVITIVLLNSMMIQRVCTRRRHLIRLSPNNNGSGMASAASNASAGASRGDSQTRLTIMIFTLTFIFCLCRLLTALELILYPDTTVGGSQQGTDEKKCELTCSIVRAVASTSTLVNSATNFVVYSIFGRKFRRCLRTLCCYCCCFWAARRRLFLLRHSFSFSSTSTRRRSPPRTTTSLSLTQFPARGGRAQSASMNKREDSDRLVTKRQDNDRSSSETSHSQL